MNQGLKRFIIVSAIVLLAVGGGVLLFKILRPADLSWEVRRPTGASFRKAKPQITIQPGKFARNSGWEMIWTGDGKCQGINVSAKQMIQCAFRTMDNTRTVMATTLPNGKYDFMSNLQNGSSNAFCQALMRKFGTVATHQMITTNVFVLTVNNTNASGLKPVADASNAKGNPPEKKPGHFSSEAANIKALTNWMQDRFHVPVLDQTGLTGKFAIHLDWNEPNRDNPNDAGLKQALIEQLGLQLAEDTQPVNMLVIEKAR